MERDAELEEERQETTKGVRRETEDRLNYLLAELNQELLTLLKGAQQTLESENPDRVRHFSASLRELFTNILHLLAPDDEVKGWSTEPTYYERGRPTRKARLFYICRLLNHDPFSTFVEKDIDTMLVFLQLFQQGTHEAASKYSDYQLRIMLTKMESTLRFLLEISRAN
jgi:Predicted pPIWI-associating nuclease